MTSEKAIPNRCRLISVGLLMLVMCLPGCVTLDGSDFVLIPAQPAKPLASPYSQRHVFAVAPLNNESGSLYADRIELADKMRGHLENTSNIDAVSMSRVLDAMGQLGLNEIRSKSDALALLQALEVDGLVVGTVTNYDPYDPPKLGLAMELYIDDRMTASEVVDPRVMSNLTSDVNALPSLTAAEQPVSVISAELNAENPDVRGAMDAYAVKRGAQDLKSEAGHRYRKSMALYSDFAMFVMTYRLMQAEDFRLQREALEHEKRQLEAQSTSDGPSLTTADR